MGSNYDECIAPVLVITIIIRITIWYWIRKSMVATAIVSVLLNAAKDMVCRVKCS